MFSRDRRWELGKKGGAGVGRKGGGGREYPLSTPSIRSRKSKKDR
jgi:hypothetical protein